MRLWLSFSIIFALITAIPTSAGVTHKTYEARELEKNAQLYQTKQNIKENLIVLEDMRLYEDDAPAAGVPEKYRYDDLDWKEALRKGIVIKKVLNLDNPKTSKGYLLVKAIEAAGNTHSLEMSINGVRFSRPASCFLAPLARQFTELGWDRWYYIDLPAGALKSGNNEILMWTESPTPSWFVLISLEEEFARGSLTRSHHPNRSFKSEDNGKTWRDNFLGSSNQVDGEYNIRISLEGYLPRGQYLSPVYDAVDGSSILKRKIIITSLSCEAELNVPEKTSIELMIRLGASPLLSDPSWTDWMPIRLDQPNFFNQNLRYFQWRAILTTSDPLISPAIKSFSITANWLDLSPNKMVGLVAYVIHNGQVVRGSYGFDYENLSHPELAKLRNTFNLDRLISGAQTEFEKFLRVLNWAYRVPVTENAYSWNWNDVVKYEKDPKTGLARLQGPYQGRRRDAMCLYSNQALIGALLSLGYQARHICIHSEGVSGHEVTEVWSNEFNKWIYLDATRDYYYFDLETGIPLNALELHNLLAEHVPRKETWERPFALEFQGKIGPKVRVGMRQGDNPFSIIEDGTHLLETMGQFRIIPRNNFLSQPLPVPVHTGATMWGWDGFLNYYDDKFPKRLEYQKQSSRILDFYEPLNQAEIYLAETEEVGCLCVYLNTFTPGGLDTYLVRLNEGKWKRVTTTSFEWKLAPGINTLEVRVINVRGVMGPASMVKVTFNP